MTDRPPDLDDARLHADLATWFEGEVRQAALDLRRAPLRPARARRGSSRSIAAPVAGAILVAILVVAGITRLPSLAPAAEPTGTVRPTTESPGPTSTATTPPATTSPAPLSPIVRRYGDGIPEFIDGLQVFRPSTIDPFPADYDRPFLLGGWSRDFAHIVPSCGLRIGTPPPFGIRCGNPFITEDPIGGQVAAVFLSGWTNAIPAGPVVLLVHRNDPLAATCEPALREQCAEIAVIEEVVWTGDDVTATSPLAPIDVFSALAAVDPDLSRAVVTPSGQLPPIKVSTPTMAPPSGTTWSGGVPRCEIPIPPIAWLLTESNFSYVMVFSTIDARAAAEPAFEASRFGCFVIVDALYSKEWIAVDNVLVAVNVDRDGPTPAQAAFVEAVREMLERL